MILLKKNYARNFAPFGKVDSVSLIIDKFSGRPRVLLLVEMPSVAEGQAAIAGLNGKIDKRTPADC